MAKRGSGLLAWGPESPALPPLSAEGRESSRGTGAVTTLSQLGETQTMVPRNLSQTCTGWLGVGFVQVGIPSQPALREESEAGPKQPFAELRDPSSSCRRASAGCGPHFLSACSCQLWQPVPGYSHLHMHSLFLAYLKG